MSAFAAVTLLAFGAAADQLMSNRSRTVQRLREFVYPKPTSSDRGEPAP